MSEISLADAAQLLKLDKATLLRMERGKMPSAETLRSVMIFLLSPNDPKFARRMNDRKRTNE